mgnify:CR=1 FL=1
MGVKIFAGRASEQLAANIAKSFGAALGDVKVSVFSDGEFQPSFEETVRGQDVFIVQSTMPPTENLFELLLLVDAARRASARKIIAVIPYFGFARQDRKDKPRVAIGAKLVANMLMAAGVDRIMTMDLHADQIQGFFEVPVDHLFASTLFFNEIDSLDRDNLVVAAPDAGGAKRANSYAKNLNCGLVLCHKHRKKANEIAEMTVIGDVMGKGTSAAIVMGELRSALRKQGIMRIGDCKQVVLEPDGTLSAVRSDVVERRRRRLDRAPKRGNACICRSDLFRWLTTELRFRESKVKK